MQFAEKLKMEAFKAVMGLKKAFLCRKPKVTIGDYTYGVPKVYLQGENKLTIGKYCSISDRVVVFLGGEHRTDFVSTFPFNMFFEGHRHLAGHPASRGDVVIGSDVWIGYGALILSGVTIGDGAVVGANAVVAKSVPPYAIVAGNPARIVRYRFSTENIERLLGLRWWDWPPDKVERHVPMIFQDDINAFLNLAERE